MKMKTSAENILVMVKDCMSAHPEIRYDEKTRCFTHICNDISGVITVSENSYDIRMNCCKEIPDEVFEEVAEYLLRINRTVCSGHYLKLERKNGLCYKAHVTLYSQSINYVEDYAPLNDVVDRGLYLMKCFKEGLRIHADVERRDDV